jgi:peroxiredoxin
VNASCRILAAIALLLAAESHASPAEARRIQESWQAALKKWSEDVRTAQPAAPVKRPDIEPYVREMWTAIGPCLDQEWVLEPTAWFLQVAPGVRSEKPDGSTSPTFAAETDAVFKALETRHLKSAGLQPICLALAGSRDPRALVLLQKIQESHPDPKTQGVAAMAAALNLKSLGDDPELIRKRLTCLRKAIIDSSDIDLGGGMTVARLAEDELYIIRYLTKGRVAPDLNGSDSAGRALRLSDFHDRIVVLLFWNSTMPEGDRVIEITAALERKFQGRPFTVLGVNRDPLEKLRSLEADGTVNWRNFSDPDGKLAQEYRVTGRPLVYVLDGMRRIHYSGVPGSFVELTAEALLSEEGSGDAEPVPSP